MSDPRVGLPLTKGSEPRLVIGVDEVGRGCLAGPVVAAAVVFPKIIEPWMSGIKDSKKLSPKKRVELANKITDKSVWSIREIPPYKIDEINILNASLLAMRDAVSEVYQKCKMPMDRFIVFVDGNHTIPEVPLAQEAIIDGDNLFLPIAAASILAKVYRDNYMLGMDSIYPEYGFAKHKGYGTEEHREAIMINGPCVLHRRTFKGVYEYV